MNTPSLVAICTVASGMAGLLVSLASFLWKRRRSSAEDGRHTAELMNGGITRTIKRIEFVKFAIRKAVCVRTTSPQTEKRKTR